MKLVIQIPCFNEERTLPATLADLPRQVPGFDVVEYLVVDDGSTDTTADVARRHGAHHLVRHTRNRGLARAFMTGLDASLRAGADVIVNTDADNQYQAADIPRLVAPILEGRAEMVIGDRQVRTVADFSAGKKLLQALGSWVVRQASSTEIPDTTSGFRAISREAALELFVHDDYTYTLETILQAGAARVPLAHVPIGTHPKTRPSRLIRSIAGYVSRSAGTIVRVYTMYRPLRAFAMAGGLFLLAGLAASGRFLYYYVLEPGRSGHVQSLILAAICIVVAFQLLLIGVVADLIAANRRLLEDVRRRVRRLELRPRERRDGDAR